jgi:hypothetical protein
MPSKLERRYSLFLKATPVKKCALLISCAAGRSWDIDQLHVGRSGFRFPVGARDFFLLSNVKTGSYSMGIGVLSI